MGLLISPDRNGGYPYAGETEDITEAVFTFTPPYPDLMPRCVPGENGGYPSLSILPGTFPRTEASVPYQTAVMRCLGEKINSGYPVLMYIEGITAEVFSDIFRNGKSASAVYLSDISASRVCCDGCAVFGYFYEASGRPDGF